MGIGTLRRNYAEKDLASEKGSPSLKNQANSLKTQNSARDGVLSKKVYANAEKKKQRARQR